jgi:hypothetical protein
MRTETGWGNTLAGLANAGSLALLLGSRLHVRHPAFNRMFDAPFADSPPPPPVSSYSTTVSSSVSASSQRNLPHIPLTSSAAMSGDAGIGIGSSIAFDYETHGRGGRFSAFADSLRASASAAATSTSSSSSSPSPRSPSQPPHLYQQHGIVVSRMCGTDPSFVTAGGCASNFFIVPPRFVTTIYFYSLLNYL